MTLYRSYQVLSARVENADGSSSWQLDVKSLTLTMDSTWAPYCQATLTCPQPAGNVVTALEPRSDAAQRLRFTLRQIESNGAYTDSRFDLGLRSRAITWTTREMVLTAASDEALMADYAPASSTTYPVGDSAGALNLVNDALYRPNNAVVLNQDSNVDVDIPYDAAQWDPSSNAWEFANTIAEAAGVRLYCDELRVWHWASPTWTPDTTVRTLTDSVANGTILEVVDTVSRDDPTWANFAVVTYSGNTPPQYVSSSGGTVSRKAIVVDRPHRKPAGNAAVKIRQAAEKRGRNLTVKAVAEIVARPLQTWRATYGDQSWQGIVQSVNFDFPSGTMQLLVNINSA